MSFALTEEQLLAGAKDVTRRLGWRNVKPGDELLAVRKCMGLRKGEKQVPLARIRVVSVRFEPLSRIDQLDCEREGFPKMNPGVFVIFFCGANRCQPETEVTRIEFEVLATCKGGVWREPCPACGSGPCTPSCPERSWRYESTWLTVTRLEVTESPARDTVAG